MNQFFYYLIEKNIRFMEKLPNEMSKIIYLDVDVDEKFPNETQFIGTKTKK